MTIYDLFVVNYWPPFDSYIYVERTKPYVIPDVMPDRTVPFFFSLSLPLLKHYPTKINL